MNSRQNQGNNIELAVLTSIQASLHQLNTRVGTLETDLRAVKDTVKEIKHSEEMTETKLSFSMQSIYDKLEYIQTELSGLRSSHIRREDEVGILLNLSVTFASSFFRLRQKNSFTGQQKNHLMKTRTFQLLLIINNHILIVHR